MLSSAWTFIRLVRTNLTSSAAGKPPLPPLPQSPPTYWWLVDPTGSTTRVCMSRWACRSWAVVAAWTTCCSYRWTTRTSLFHTCRALSSSTYPGKSTQHHSAPSWLEAVCLWVPPPGYFLFFFPSGLCNPHDSSAHILKPWTTQEWLDGKNAKGRKVCQEPIEL